MSARFVPHSAWLSVYWHVPARLPLDRFQWNIVLVTSMKLCWGNPNLVKIPQSIGPYTWEPQHVALSPATMKLFFRNAECFYIFDSDIWQQYKLKALLLFHCRRACAKVLQCYLIVILTLLFTSLPTNTVVIFAVDLSTSKTSPS